MFKAVTRWLPQNLTFLRCEDAVTVKPLWLL